MKIGLFEDNDEHAANLTEAIKKWAEQCGRKAVVTRFSSAFEAKELTSFDCLLLDVEMPGMNGIDLAREIRGTGNNIPIVFVSSHTEYSIDGYEVNALRFIDKNAHDFNRRFAECMDKTAYEVDNSLNAYYNIRSSRKMTSIPMHEILFFEVYDHDLVTHTVTGTFRERKTVKELKKDLPKQFVQIGKSHILNVLQTVQITSKQALLRDGTTIPVAPKYSDALFEAYLEMR